MVQGAQVAPQKASRAQEMRAAPTPAEALAWDLLRGRKICGLKFRRQQVIQGFIVDFYCAQHRLAVEIDGAKHLDPHAKERDENRTGVLAALGIRVLRVRNPDVDAETLTQLLTPLAAG